MFLQQLIRYIWNAHVTVCYSQKLSDSKLCIFGGDWWRRTTEMPESNDSLHFPHVSFLHILWIWLKVLYPFFLWPTPSIFSNLESIGKAKKGPGGGSRPGLLPSSRQKKLKPTAVVCFYSSPSPFTCAESKSWITKVESRSELWVL